MAIIQGPSTRRTRPRSDSVYDDGYLRIEHENYYVSCGGQTVNLARTEFLVLSRLARTPGRIVGNAELWEYVWGTGKPVNAESIHVYIYRLRNKFANCRLSIETMVNVGYRLVLQQPTPV
ncbi:MAG TPA: winged helix-turn-helix domain-containing protein [Pyrinomonadaceae bacterium]|nr:winged helix-turn-helix domain-containing protein [Pyrinomonadaceae bacterium]